MPSSAPILNAQAANAPIGRRRADASAHQGEVKASPLVVPLVSILDPEVRRLYREEACRSANEADGGSEPRRGQS